MHYLLVLAATMQLMATRPADEERLSFQSYAAYGPRLHVNADVAMVYGVDPSLPERLKGWRDAGYIPHVMTGVSWGGYQDYLYGKFDGINHEDEAQTEKNGTKISHGGDVYYMSPGASYGRYLCEGVKRAIDAGAHAIHLEEPEFWVRAGWEPSFRRQWKAFYGEDWVAPDSSPDAQWRASKLKYMLYRRALADVFGFVRDYSKRIGREVKCYVPSHSLLNYAHWGIVSPESSLLEVGCDGYIAQVWTGTARTPNLYKGVLRERTFDTAFLEYGVMENLVRASGRRVWFLHDPVEDNPNHTWADYRTNWQCTVVASLLHPDVWRYEIMPWPDRIFAGKYPKADGTKELERIPAAYETELQAVFTALGDMKQGYVKWEMAGTRGVGVLVSDTMMFQRFGPGRSEGHLSSFYGLALPLVKQGIPAIPVQLENVGTNGFLDPFKLLVLTYEGQKPPKAELHDRVEEWVRAGGALVVVDDDADPYHKVREWWNTGGNQYSTARVHLFKKLGLAGDFEGMKQVGKGAVVRMKQSPAEVAKSADCGPYIAKCSEAAKAVGLGWERSPALVLRRGPFVVAAALEEAAVREKRTLRGRFLSLFDGRLPLVKEVALEEGTRALLVDLDRVGPGPRIVAAAGKVSDVSVGNGMMKFRCAGLEGSRGVVCVAMEQAPREVKLDGKRVEARWEEGVLWAEFGNRAEGVSVEIDL